MHSKILNMQWNDNPNSFYCDIPTDLMNIVQKPTTVITPCGRIFRNNAWQNITLTELANYPITNMTNNFSQFKETKISKVDFASGSNSISWSGITIDTAGYGGTPNTIALLFNVSDKTYRRLLQKGTIRIMFRHKIDESLSRFFGANEVTGASQKPGLFGTRLTSPTTSTSVFSDISHYRMGNENGKFIIGETELFKLFGTPYVNIADYYIDVMFIKLTLSGDPVTDDNFQISNMFIGKSVDFFAEENMKYMRKNLNVYSSGKRSGKTITQINQSLKSLNLAFTNLTTSHMIDDMINYYRENKDFPICVFPYNKDMDASVGPLVETTELEGEYQTLNYEMGALYYIDSDFEMTNSKYDVYNYNLKLIEYK